MKREQQSECEGCCCGVEEQFYLLTVRHRGTFRRFCTDCLLKNHQGLFCPVCLDVFSDESPPPPPTVRLMCLACPSITHRSCADDESSSSSASFTCPPCSNPNFTFFRKKRRLDAVGTDDEGIDKQSAKALVSAARIAVASMKGAADSARNDMEKRMKESALSKKRAKEGLEHVALLDGILGERDPNNYVKPEVEKKLNGNDSSNWKPASKKPNT